IAMTATELGRNSTTSGAAVIRLCKSLNLKGFQELKIRIAGDLQKTTEHGYRDIKPTESVASITEKMTSNSIQTIRETADLLSTEELQRAVNILSEARRIHSIGVGASGIIAQDAQQKFLRVDKLSDAFSDMHTAATLVANANADKGGLVIGISFSGETAAAASLVHLSYESTLS